MVDVEEKNLESSAARSSDYWFRYCLQLLRSLHCQIDLEWPGCWNLCCVDYHRVDIRHSAMLVGVVVALIDALFRAPLNA